MSPHTCGPGCRALGFAESHERLRLAARRKRQARLKGHRVKVRWLGGHPPPAHWQDVAWAAVWG